MKVKVQNLGTIKSAEIEIKPLTIFIGPNNSGKTWFAYSLASIFDWTNWSKYYNSLETDKIEELYPPIANLLQNLQEEGIGKLDIKDFADKYGEIYFNEIAKNLRFELAQYLATNKASFDNLSIYIDIADIKSLLLKKVFESEKEDSLGVGKTDKQRKRALLKVLKEANSDSLIFYAEADVSEKLSPRIVKNFVLFNIFTILHRSIYPFIYIFPTERTGLISLAFAGFRNIEKTRRVTSDIGTDELNTKKRTSAPISNFLSTLAVAFGSSLIERKKQAEANTQIQNYLQLASILDKQILKGQIDFSTEEESPNREILFTPDDESSLEVSVASSMAKELTPLSLCLRYLADPNEWIVFDEPEMNLHPKAQARLIELLAMVAQANMPVLLTTHSSYIVDHLANLIKAAKSDKKEEIAELFFLKNSNAFIPQEKVSVYFFHDGTAENILDEEGSINWETFSKVSDKINEIFFTI